MPSKTANKTTSKAGAKPAAKKAMSTKPAAKRTTVSSLATSLKSLETRLKGADTKNRNAIKSLEGVVKDLKAAAKVSNTTHKAALTRGLNTLEIRMETYLKRASYAARANVRAELATVTAPDAGLDTLKHAVDTAHSKLDQIELAQRESISRLNRHIVGIATSVEARLVEEAKARENIAADMTAKINRVDQRVDQVEIDTAVALETIGDKVAEFAAVLEDRSKKSDADTAERLADLAQETQSEFNHAQIDMTTRLEALETIAANWSPTKDIVAANMNDPRVDDMADTVRALQQELSRMHARIAAIQSERPVVEVQHEAPAQIAPTNVVPMPMPITQGQVGQAPFNLGSDNPYAEAAQAILASNSEDLNAQAPQVQTSPAPQAKAKRAKDSHIPQEFDPSAFQATTAPYSGMQATQPAANPPLMPASGQATQLPPMSDAPYSVPAPYAPLSEPDVAGLSATLPPPPAPPMAPPMASSGEHAPVASVIDPVMPAPLPVSTYADPAYAEDNEMRAERIGEEGKSRSLPKLPITGQHLRVGALAAGVAVVGLFAAKSILGGPNTAIQNAQNDLQSPAPAISDAPSFDTQPILDTQTVSTANIGVTPSGTIEPIAPLGSYAETQTPQIIPGQETTLETAVAAGNPIAQFQMGLAKLQAGDHAEAANLIRLSANRNQPAAQYRLAKLYENGTGVKKDIVTARELVERAALGGNRIAMHDLGNYFAYGQGGLDRNMGQALSWFSKAAERGVVDSQFNVAFLSEGNEGVSANLETALFWYHVAARQGDQGAPERIAALNAQMSETARSSVKSRADRFNPKPVDEAANGIFRDVPWIKTATTKKVDPVRTAEIIRTRDVQLMLTDLGYQIGGADGAAGPKTRAAIREFEKVNGLPETGQITDDLIERLEIAAGA